MNLQNSQLVLRQIDKKLQGGQSMKDNMPDAGWMRPIRVALRMTLQQLANKMLISIPSLAAMEKRESEGSITLTTLRNFAEALDMTLVYGFVPKDGSLEKMIERRARAMAEKIVQRTSTTMRLEGQGNSEERIKQAIEELTQELIREMPDSLWD